jgi:hypothetical protein
MHSRQIIRTLERDGWRQVRVTGDIFTSGTPTSRVW